MKIKHYQGRIATLQVQWDNRDTMRDIINRQKRAQRDARLVQLFTR
jgi:hypothetical protein